MIFFWLFACKLVTTTLSQYQTNIMRQIITELLIIMH